MKDDKPYITTRNPLSKARSACTNFSAMTLEYCDERATRVIEEFELDDYLETLHNDWFIQMKKDERAFVESIDPSFKISSRSRYLQDQLEKARTRLYELGNVDLFSVKKESKKFFSEVPKNIAMYVYSWFREKMFSEKKILNKKINSYKIELSLLEETRYRKKDDRVTESEIEEASKKDLSFLFSKKKRSGNNYIVNCIFHNEKTGSMFLFKDGHFHCFGCGQHGSVIDLYMKINSCDFKTAVRELLKI